MQVTAKYSVQSTETLQVGEGGYLTGNPRANTRGMCGLRLRGLLYDRLTAYAGIFGNLFDCV